MYPALLARANRSALRFENRRFVHAAAESRIPGGADRTKNFGLSVFSEFTPLAVQHKAVNLGQGFPDFHAPDFVIEEAQKALGNHINQYTRANGHLRLVNALSSHFSPLFQRKIDPMNEIVTTVGATEGIFTTMQALINPGDEVVIIQPFYDSYPPSVECAGGKCRYISLKPGSSSSRSGAASSADWRVDMRDLERAINAKTKMIVINNPSNIPGKVFSREELLEIASIVKKHNLLVLADEVYEAMVYAPNSHTRIASLPGMFERTVTLGSAGKSFSVTGFKIGWAIGPKPLIHAIGSVHQFVTFCVAAPLQEAIAVAFEQAPKRRYFEELTDMYTRKRAALLSAIKGSGLTPVESQGSYFVMADFSQVKESVYMRPENQNGVTDHADYQFCRWLTKEIGVAAIPLSPFYSDPRQLPGKYARFTFCKRDEVIADGAKRLQKLKQFI